MNGSALPPVPRQSRFLKNSTRRTLNEDYAKPPPLTSSRIRSKYGLDFLDHEPYGTSRSRRSSITELDTPKTPSLSRRNSVKNGDLPSSVPRRSTAMNFESTNRVPRPFSASYALTTPSASTRASPVREISYSGLTSRRGSVTKLPWPEPSPIREIPPSAPKTKIKHYPLPPPSYAEGMIAVSRRLRNRSASPAPNYSELELSSRPGLVPAALGRPSPSREMIRMTLCGPQSHPLKQYHY